MKYLVCDSYARAKGISRECMIAQVEAMGVLYEDGKYPDDFFTVERHPDKEDDRAIVHIKESRTENISDEDGNVTIKEVYDYDAIKLPEVHRNRLADSKPTDWKVAGEV